MRLCPGHGALTCLDDSRTTHLRSHSPSAIDADELWGKQRVPIPIPIIRCLRPAAKTQPVRGGGSCQDAFARRCLPISRGGSRFVLLCSAGWLAGGRDVLSSDCRRTTINSPLAIFSGTITPRSPPPLRNHHASRHSSQRPKSQVECRPGVYASSRSSHSVKS